MWAVKAAARVPRVPEPPSLLTKGALASSALKLADPTDGGLQLAASNQDLIWEGSTDNGRDPAPR